jgi:hypothetical protein
MKITRNAIILSNRESRAAGHHGNADCDDRAADRFGGEIRQAAHDTARRTGRYVEVFATRRGCQPWIVYACEAER